MNLEKTHRGFVWNEVVNVTFFRDGEAWVCKVPWMRERGFDDLDAARSFALRSVAPQWAKKFPKLNYLLQAGGLKNSPQERASLQARVEAARNGDPKAFAEVHSLLGAWKRKEEAKAAAILQEREERCELERAAEERELAHTADLRGLLADDLSMEDVRLILADKLSDLEREDEAALCRDLGQRVRVLGGDVLPRDFAWVGDWDFDGSHEGDAWRARVFGPWDRAPPADWEEGTVHSEAPDWAGPFETTVETPEADLFGRTTVFARYYQAYLFTTDEDRELFRQAVLEDVEDRIGDYVAVGESVVIRYSDGGEVIVTNLPIAASLES